MVSPFDRIAARTLDRVFAKFGRAASYAPPDGGAAISCRVVLNRADDVANVDKILLVAEQRLIEVSKSDVTSPGPEQDRFQGRATRNPLRPFCSRCGSISFREELRARPRRGQGISRRWAEGSGDRPPNISGR
jgi:hypothetical protein